jgi:anti-sigma B factor antagonist
MQPRTLEFVLQKTGDANTGNVFTLLCHGQLVIGTVAKLKEAIKPLLGEGGRIIVDLGEVLYVDSTGIGAMVGLKFAAAGATPPSKLEFCNLSYRVQELIRFTHLEPLLQT